MKCLNDFYSFLNDFSQTRIHLSFLRSIRARDDILFLLLPLLQKNIPKQIKQMQAKSQTYTQT